MVDHQDLHTCLCMELSRHQASHDNEKHDWLGGPCCQLMALLLRSNRSCKHSLLYSSHSHHTFGWHCKDFGTLPQLFQGRTLKVVTFRSILYWWGFHLCLRQAASCFLHRRRTHPTQLLHIVHLFLYHSSTRLVWDT